MYKGIKCLLLSRINTVKQPQKLNITDKCNDFLKIEKNHKFYQKQ